MPTTQMMLASARASRHLAFKYQALLLYGVVIHFLGRLFLDQRDCCAAKAGFSCDVGYTQLVFTHHAGEMAADNSCASKILVFD